MRVPFKEFVCFLVSTSIQLAALGQNGWNTFKVEQGIYHVPGSGTVGRYLGREYDTIRSSVRFYDYEVEPIRFGSANYSGDTLIVRLYETNPVQDHHLTIKILNLKFKADYYIIASTSDTPFVFKQLITKLKLESLPAKGRNATITGRVQLFAECINCSEKEIIISLKGDFQIPIR